ncbi:hypothetical protein ACFOUP_17325, partial [Belliella kenyensis]
MKKILLLLLFAIFIIDASAQVGVGTATPSSSAQLDIVSSDRGILIPRVRLSNDIDDATIVAGNVESLLVYNTNDNGIITPGYYYWFRNRWRRLAWTGAGQGSNNFVTYNPTTNEFYYTNEEGDLVLIDMGELFEETVTTLVVVAPGVYRYTNEEGTITLIDVPADVVNNINSGGSIYDEILNLIEEFGGGNVYYDGTQLTYINDEGVTQVINLPEMIVNQVVNDIRNEGAIYEEIINLITENGGNVYYDGSQFTYIDDNGVTQV